MRHRHPEDGELVWLAGQRAAGGHHVRQLRDVRRHLVSAPAFDFAVILPAVRDKDKPRSSRELCKAERRYSSEGYDFNTRNVPGTKFTLKKADIL